MLKLLKTDLKRIIKDKLFFVVCIIGLVFSIITPLLYVGIESLLFVEDESGKELFSSMFYAKDLFFSSFNTTSNFGLILPILIAIILCKDFSYGTIRNKIISGNSRTNIFISMFLSGSITLIGVIFAHALLTMGISLLFFDYSSTPFTLSSLGFLLLSILFEILAYLFIVAIICFLAVFMKNAGLCIVIYVAINLVLLIVSTIIGFGLDFAKTQEINQSLVNILTFLNGINVFNNIASSIGFGDKYELSNILYNTIPSIVYSTGLVSLGIVVFNKKDIK